MKRRVLLRAGCLGLMVFAGCASSELDNRSQDESNEPELETTTPKPLTDNPQVNQAKELLDSFINDLNSDLYEDTARIEHASGELGRFDEDPLRLEAYIQYQVRVINEEQFQNDLEYGIGSVAFLYAEYVRQENWEVEQIEADVFKQGDPYLRYELFRSEAQAVNTGDISEDEYLSRIESSIEHY